jgi:hypothetical protein
LDGECERHLNRAHRKRKWGDGFAPPPQNENDSNDSNDPNDPNDPNDSNDPNDPNDSNDQKAMRNPSCAARAA